MDYAWIEVSQEVMRDVEIYSVSINSVHDDVAINIDNIPSTYNATVEDADGNIINSYKFGETINFRRSGDTFFRIIYSPALPNGPTAISGNLLPEDQYYVSSSESEELYFERLFYELNRSYFSNYTDLKKKINLPNRVDFGFIVNFNDKQIRAVNNIPDGLEVLSRSDRVESMRNSSKREYAELTVLVW